MSGVSSSKPEKAAYDLTSYDVGMGDRAVYSTKAGNVEATVDLGEGWIRFHKSGEPITKDFEDKNPPKKTLRQAGQLARKSPKATTFVKNYPHKFHPDCQPDPLPVKEPRRNPSRKSSMNTSGNVKVEMETSETE
jgi:hypothetical protein